MRTITDIRNATLCLPVIQVSVSKTFPGVCSLHLMQAWALKFNLLISQGLPLHLHQTSSHTSMWQKLSFTDTVQMIKTQDYSLIQWDLNERSGILKEWVSESFSHWKWHAINDHSRRLRKIESLLMLLAIKEKLSKFAMAVLLVRVKGLPAGL